MSFRNKGTTGPMVVISRIPDYSGNLTCDGTADDVELQAAVDYLNTLGGGTVVIKEGNYSISASVVMRDNVVIKGSGYSTILTMTSGADLVNGIFNLTSRSNISFHDIHFEGDRTNNPVNCTLIYCNNTADAIIERCAFEDAEYGVLGWSNQDVIKVTECSFYDNERHVSFSAATQVVNDIGFSECRFEQSSVRGVTFQYCHNLQFINNTLINLARGIYVYESENIIIADNVLVDPNQSVADSGGIQTNTNCSNIVIGNNIILFENNPSNTANGIVVQSNQENITVTGNVIEGGDLANINAGIYFHGTSDVSRDVEIGVISDNVISDCDDGIIVTYSQYVDINDNAVYSVGTYGIYLSSSDYITVQGNQSLDAGSDALIFETSDEGYVEGNYFIDSVRYDIYILAGCLNNHIGKNKLTGTGVACFQDLGTDTITPEIFVNTIDPLTTLGDHPVVTLTDNATTNVYNSINLPLGFQQLVTAQLIVTPGGTGNMRWQLDTDFGKICANENYNTHSESVAANDTAVDLNQMECLDISTALTGIAAGDLIGFNFARIGAHANDTVNADCYYMGIRLRYV